MGVASFVAPSFLHSLALGGSTLSGAPAVSQGPEAAEVGERAFDAYVSSNRTCEIGLTSGTGKPYRSIIELVEERSRKAG